MVTLEIQTAESCRFLQFTGSSIVIGRSDDCDIVIDDLRLSRVHARLFIDNQQLWISDESSLNGTLINENLLKSSSIKLNDNDRIILTPEITITIHSKENVPYNIAINQINDQSIKANNQKYYLSNSVKNTIYAIIIGLLVLVVIIVVHAYTKSNQTKLISSTTKVFNTFKTSNSESPVIRKRHSSIRYNSMSEAEKLLFLKERINYINKLTSNGEIAIEKNIIGYIKTYVDQYNMRIGSGKEGVFRDDLNSVLERGKRFAPIINKSFKRQRISQVIGLYVAMIESEFHQCLESPAGARGMFQFIPKSAEEFGLDPDDRCNVELAAPAAAKYIATRIKQFNGEGDPNGVALCIAAYNRNPKSIMRDLRIIMNKEFNTDRSFWLLLANQEQLDHYFQSENVKYVPKFFAAAIIGETPQVFGLDSVELSSISDVN
jgi:pSer/pThr/pTyr-binding forkhead associated (FHA) protein